MRDPIDPRCTDDGEQGLTPLDIAPERSSPVSLTKEPARSATRCSAQYMWEISTDRHGDPSTEEHDVELFRCATKQGDQDARVWVQQRFSELVRTWLQHHPSREAACRLESEEHYVAAAFERFWQSIGSTPGEECNRLSVMLRYLYASLNGAVLDTLRVVSRPQGSLKPSPDVPGEPQMEDLEDAGALWTHLQQRLPNERSQRLAYLLFHSGLSPTEIIQRCPHEFRDVQEISRLRRNILERLLRNGDTFTSG